MKFIREYLGTILTVIMSCGLLLFSFVGIGLRAEIDSGFWVSFVTNFTVMILTTTIWFPTGKDKAEQKDENYIKQRTEYGKLVSDVVETNNFKGLNDFCEYATGQNRIDLIKRKLMAINVDYEDYLKYKGEPIKIDENAILTPKQKQKLKKLIEKGVKVKKINPARVTTGIKRVKARYDTETEETKFDTIKLVSKVLTSIAFAIGMGFVVFSIGGFTWGTIAQFMMWMIIMVWNLWTSVRSGYKSVAVYRADFYKKLRTFLEEFKSTDYFNKKPEEKEEN